MRASAVGAIGIVSASCALLDPFPDLAPDPPSGDGDSAVPPKGGAAARPDEKAVREPGSLQWAVLAKATLPDNIRATLAVAPSGTGLLAFSGSGDWDVNGKIFGAQGRNDVGLVWVEPNGTVRSARRYQFGDRANVSAVAFDSEEAIWVCGGTGLGGVPILRKLAPSGDEILTAGVTSTGETGSILNCYDVHVGPSGHVLATLRFAGKAVVTGMDGGTTIVTTDGSLDSLVVRIEPLTGRIVWARAIGQEGDIDDTFAVALDAQGEAYIAGTFASATMPFPGVTRKGTRDNAFVAKLAAEDGSVRWAHAWGDTAEMQILAPGELQATSRSVRAQAIAVDGNGHVAVGGRYRGTVDFEGEKRSGDLPGFYVMMLDGASGGRRWWKPGRAPQGADVAGLAFDGMDSLAIVGTALNAGHAVGDLDGVTFAAEGQASAFAGAITMDGHVRWARAVGLGPSLVVGGACRVDVVRTDDTTSVCHPSGALSGAWLLRHARVLCCIGLESSRSTNRCSSFVRTVSRSRYIDAPSISSSTSCGVRRSSSRRRSFFVTFGRTSS